MKNPMEVLRSKEQEVLRVKKEIEALRIAARLLGDEGRNGNNEDKQDLHQLVEMP
ncbi:MAG: hypothetical protein LAO03_14870 [Acidobacteriia bacterium]|nr:hypothetical protein [Terriglobia bacterium]